MTRFDNFKNWYDLASEAWHSFKGTDTTRFDNFKNWYDLASETWREYVTADGQIYRIDNPKKFFVNKVSGTHYVLDSEGIVHTLPASVFTVLRFNDTDGISFVGMQNGDTRRTK